MQLCCVRMENDNSDLRKEERQESYKGRVLVLSLINTYDNGTCGGEQQN